MCDSPWHGTVWQNHRPRPRMVADSQLGPIEAPAKGRDAGDLCVVWVAERGGLHPPPVKPHPT